LLTPLNCYYFTRQSYSFAHLTSFAALLNSLSKTRLIRNSFLHYRRFGVHSVYRVSVYFFIVQLYHTC